MNNFKIIKLEPKYPNVLVKRERNHTGTESVEIFTIGVYAGDEDIFASEEVVFENHKAAQSFVKRSSICEAWLVCSQVLLKLN